MVVIVKYVNKRIPFLVPKTCVTYFFSPLILAIILLRKTKPDLSPENQRNMRPTALRQCQHAHWQYSASATLISLQISQ